MCSSGGWWTGGALLPVGLPSVCFPVKTPRGKYSYTLCDRRGRRVEALLKKRAFYMKSNGAAEKVPYPTVTWSKYSSIDDAWAAVVDTIGWDV